VEKRAESKRERNERRATEGEKEKRRRREGMSFLLLINYFRDKRWPAVEKKRERADVY